ncbi:MAG: glycosyltransferase family 2 protein [Holosporales bacterium]|nr:glycosyltransferase family 2 protein [Holosporales bacterium]
MEEKPLVTIAIPTYKRPHLLPRALESVANQTYKPLEVLVIDNGTPGEKNAETIKSFQKRITKLFYEKAPENRGETVTNLRCINKAKGEFFMWLCDDDTISPTYIEAAVETLQAYPEASFSALQQKLVFSDHEYTTFPDDYMDDSWFRRMLIFTIVNGCGKDGWMRGLSWIYGLHRTAPLRKATKGRLEEVRFWWPNQWMEAGTLNDFLILPEALLMSKVVPVTRKDAVLITSCCEKKEYVLPGEGSAGFFGNQINKLKGAIFWVNLYWIHTKQVYKRGTFCHAILFAGLSIVILLYKLFLSLRQQVEGRLKKRNGGS